MNNEYSIDKILREIAKNIEISETEHEKAVTSYNAIGNYIDGRIDEFNVRVIPQGSFMLGTVIRPINDKDEYDIDLVTIIDNKFHDAKDLKNIVGDALKKHQIYSQNLVEGKRCWTIEYSESAKYHVDVLPAMKNETYDFDKKLSMTHKSDENSKYEFKTTNPEKYFDWFNTIMKKEKQMLIESFAKAQKIDIKDVPDYKVKTTLQIAIEILKRYRDIKFKDDSDNKPISIILTTIMARVYTGNENVYELIAKFSNEYSRYLEKDSKGNFKISNPVNEEENFADKWEMYPERKIAFFRFIDELKKDIVDNTFLKEGEFIKQSEIYKNLFGQNVVKRVYESFANENRIKREESGLYIKENGNITDKKTNINVKNHNFYGKN